MKKLLIIALVLHVCIAKAQYFEHLYGTADNDVLYSGINTVSIIPQSHLLAGVTQSYYYGASVVSVSFNDGDGNIPGAPFFSNMYRISNTFGNVVDAYDPNVFERTNCCTGFGIVGRYTDNNACPAGRMGIFFLQLKDDGTPETNFEYHFPDCNVVSVGGVSKSQFFPGEVYITGTVEASNGARYPFGIRVNECNGAVKWGWAYYMMNPASEGTGRDIEENPSLSFGAASVAIVGTTNHYGSPDGFLMHIDANTGFVLAPFSIYGSPFSSDHLNSINKAGNGTGTPGFILGGGTDAYGNMDFAVVLTDALATTTIFSSVFDYSTFSGVNNDCFDVVERYTSPSTPLEYYAVGDADNGIFGLSDIMVIKIDQFGNGIANGEFAYGSSNNDYGRKIDLYSPVGGAPPAGLSVYGTWRNIPSIGGDDLYFIKTYFNGITPCNYRITTPLQYTGNPLYQQAHATPFIPNSIGILNTSFVSMLDMTVCYSVSEYNGDNARIALEDKADHAVLVMPNPTTTNYKEVTLKVDSDIEGTADVEIYDMLGKQYYNKKHTLVKGTNNLPIEVSNINMAPGMYNVKLSNAHQNKTVVLIVK